MDISKLFNEPKFSDLILQLSDGEQISVHKIVLCGRSEYFNKLCGPDSRFAESEQAIVELKGDDPVALKYLLRYIYMVPSVDQDAPTTWRLWLDIRTTADKYLEPDLSKSADREFRSEVHRVHEDIDQIFDIIDTIERELSHDEPLVALSIKLRKDNPGQLLKSQRFRDKLDEGGKEALWQQLDELAFATNLVKKHVHLCEEHAEDAISDVTWAPCIVCPKEYYHKHRRFSGPVGVTGTVIWTSK